MKNILAIVLVALCALPTSAEALTAKYDQLDAELAKRDMYVNAKLKRHVRQCQIKSNRQPQITILRCNHS